MNPTSETSFFHSAVEHWWASKKAAPKKKAQGGTRDANLHGRTMDGFAWILRDFLIGLGVQKEHIFSGGHLTRTPSILPSYFRPSKNWDLVVIGGSRCYPAPGDSGGPILYAAVEFKSQDKSIGNNQNNRLEESIGNAHDFWTTYAHLGFERQQPRPWLGYLFVGNYEPEADDRPVRIEQPHFRVMEPFRTGADDGASSPNFAGPSYCERYQIFMRQSVGARLYDAGAFIVTSESISSETPNHRVPIPEFGPATFLRSLKAQVLAHYPGAQVLPGTSAASL